MNIYSFPLQIQQLVRLESFLGKDLSLEEIEEIEQQIQLAATDKTQEIAKRLLNCFEEKKDALVDRQIKRLDSATDPDQKYQFLKSLIGYLPPEKFDQKLSEVKILEIKNPKIKKALEHLQFAQANPIIYDLAAFIAQTNEVQLEKLASIAEAFYFGRVKEGMRGLSDLPENIRLKIDQLIWDAGRGQPVDLTEKKSQEFMCGAILFSLEERMGMHAHR